MAKDKENELKQLIEDFKKDMSAVKWDENKIMDLLKVLTEWLKKNSGGTNAEKGETDNSKGEKPGTEKPETNEGGKKPTDSGKETDKPEQPNGSKTPAEIKPGEGLGNKPDENKGETAKPDENTNNTGKPETNKPNLGTDKETKPSTTDGKDNTGGNNNSGTGNKPDSGKDEKPAGQNCHWVCDK